MDNVTQIAGLAGPDVRELRSRIAGEVYVPGDDAWDEARQAWNLSVDQRPTAVVVVEGANDVAEAIDFARENDLRVAPQGTGHAASAIRRHARHDLAQDASPARRHDRPRAADRPRRSRRDLDRRRRGGRRARPRRALRVVAGRRRRRLHARRRALVARAQARHRRQQRDGDRARDGGRRVQARRPRPRPRPLLGAARRRRQLRRRDGDRVQPLPVRAGLCRHPLVPGRARDRGPDRVARLDGDRPGGDDVGRPDHAVPAARVHSGAGSRQVVRRRRGDLRGRRRRRRALGCAAARARPGHGHGRRRCRCRSSHACTWIRRDRRRVSATARC